MSAERCERCERPLPTEEQWDDDKHPQGCQCDLCVAACWADGVACARPGTDWRTRALAAEAEAERLRGVVERARKVADAFTDVVVNDDDTESQWCDGCGTAGCCESGCPFDALRVALSSLTAAGER